MRITARMPVLRMRIRITRPRIRMRISGLANDFQKGKNINFESNDPASRQKISPQKGVSRRFRASRTAERPEYEKQSVEMKRIGNLYEKIISLDNLRLADEKARRGKLRSYGVLLHDKNREANILALHETLKNHTFKNSEYSTFTIYEPKERIIFRLPRTGRTSTGAASISSGSCSTTTKRSCANPSSRISAAWPRV